MLVRMALLLAVFSGVMAHAREKNSHDPEKIVYVLLLGGQSNTLGWGYQQYLEDIGSPLAKPQDDVEMFYGIAGQLERPEGVPKGTLIPLQSGSSNNYLKPLPNCYPNPNFQRS